MQVYVSPIIGIGTFFDPYRPALADARVNHGAEIPTDETGKPINDQCVVAVAEVTSRAKLDDQGESLTDKSGRRVFEQVSSEAVVSRDQGETVTDVEAARLAVETKARIRK